MRRWLSAGCALAALAIAALWLHSLPGITWSVGTEALASMQAEKNFPHPETLALPPGFNIKSAHPRLPHPPANYSPEAKTPRARYTGMHPLIAHRILAARLTPTPALLAALFKDLRALYPRGRGMDEAKALALGYDWLYAMWTPAQRKELLARTLDACEYEIAVIRASKLSPYNVILYNAPLQGLMTCALATYGDDPRATPVMAFTYDLWKNRVLPVWRQVMGRNGGWHEGGEYVGIGIGQAIFQLPNMWRAATGEDLFKSEPGIHGFLDFLIHRTQPDGRYVSLGDAAFFNRGAPDALALALELRNAAAYTLLMRPDFGEPTSWPWGPSPDPALIVPDAARHLPLSRCFDGIGTLFARSGWDVDATHVSFRAGDNYWSHSHLDQGSFTVFKGTELAIDSGLYYRSLSEHHLNYTYQSIAHNTLTITDPEDRVPAPGVRETANHPQKPARPIANDGGQRRIGSGWGVEEAPMDLAEWMGKREIYHTGVMENYFDNDGLTVAVADITPAYTNTLSGQGTFSHRTRRAERVWRIFAYDRVNDIVVVFDNISATRAEFKKRWLLHSVQQPTIGANTFSIAASVNRLPAPRVASIKGWVLLPTDARIEPMGGRGQEFWIDGQNYDDHGEVRRRMHWLPSHSKHPGEWRLEISPALARQDDLFLVVMAPTLDGAVLAHGVDLMRHGQWVGANVRTTMRSTRFWFSPERNGLLIDISDEQGLRRHEMWAGNPIHSIAEPRHK